MSNNSISKSQTSTSFGRTDLKPISVGRSSFRIQHYSNGNQIPSIGSSPRARPSPWSSYSNNGSLNDNSWRDSFFGEVTTPTETHSFKRRTKSSVPKSSGLVYCTKFKKELASIDKINDPTINGLICAGKAHLGYYRFSKEDHSISCVHDFLATDNHGQGSSFSPIMKKRGRQAKISTIADVKTGYFNHKNYTAICHNSTIVSVYDLNKTSSIDNPLVTNLSEHTRSVNSFDFNSVQTNLLISGGQDACVKVWDLRSSSTNKGSRSDVRISTASDSIRDVKWMPIQNYAQLGSQQDSKSGNNAGYKFASIHDSGLLLLFDLRQPNQIERKINAHTGLGLCLNWHPNCEYIATGGRDGKCCLWYVGDKSQNGYSAHFLQTPPIHTSHGLNTNGSNSLAVLPDVTINTGLPVTKLKFCPSYDKNPFNASLALSSMSDEAAVNVYSLARKYIPKHVLQTAAPSLGLVWWDDQLIFGIDKDDHITGWDIQKEPTVLHNLPKCTTKWRDIGGSGLLFIDQESGSYEIDTNITIYEDKKNQTQKLNTPVTTSKSNSRFMDNLKKGISHANLSSLQPDRQATSKSGPSLSSKSLGPSSLGLSHHNLSISSSPFNFPNETSETINIESPSIMILDLPLILTSMRTSRIPSVKSNVKSPEISAIMESPISVFKFLARELEFSYSHAKKSNETRSNNTESNSNDEEIKEDILERFGLSENTTWAALVNKKNENDANKNRNQKRGSNQTFNASDAGSNSKQEVEESTNSDNGLKKKKSALTESINDISAATQQKLDLLMELIPICSHNASVYSYIEDIPNFKIWLLIRDSLLWDLKKLTSDNSGLSISDSEIGQNEQEIRDKILSEHAEDNVFSESACVSGATSGINSYIDETPQALHDGFRNNDKKSLNSENTYMKHIPTPGSTPSMTYQQHLAHNNHQDENNKDLNRAMSTENLSDQNVSDIEYDYGIEDADGFSSTTEEKGIPILGKRQHRPSFIDTFMTDVRLPGNLEQESYFKTRQSHSLTHSSPTSKISSLNSLNHNTSPNIRGKKMINYYPPNESQDANKSPVNQNKISEFGKLLAQQFPADQLKGGLSSIKAKSKCYTPPWNTRKLIKQLYKQAAETGNILLAVNILLLFQKIYHITATDMVKSSLAQFTTILHQYELFEISAAILKYCPWDDIMHTEGDQSSIQLFCDRCGTLITNESSKERFTLESQKVGNEEPMKRFGCWYCDACKKPNTLCVICETPLKDLSMVLLDCGHEGHFACLKEWFLEEEMTECPAGCMNNIDI